MPTPSVTILSSLHPLAREAAVTRARLHRPDVVVLHHELGTLPGDGSVHRVERSATGETDTSIPVTWGCCLSCLLREDTLAALRALDAIPVLLVLPTCVEPAMVARVLHEHSVVHLDAIVTVVDPAALEADLWSHRSLGADDPSAPGDDERSVAEVLGRQLQHADIVLHPPASDRTIALLDALAPAARRVPADAEVARWIGSARHDAERLERSLAIAVPCPRVHVDRHGVTTATWSRRRPLHPQRFLDTCEDGSLADVIRATGHLWVATRPSTVLEAEMTGGSYELAAVDAWLAAVPVWDRVEGSRREAASTRWHPYWGDRAQDLELVCVERDTREVIAALDACLLTDHELSEGEDGWTSWPDPFASWFGDEAELLTPTPDTEIP